jgi:pyruvate kinase
MTAILVLQVAAAKGKLLSYALDTKGPEIRTAMLKGGKDIMLTKGDHAQHTSCRPAAALLLYMTKFPAGQLNQYL